MGCFVSLGCRLDPHHTLQTPAVISSLAALGHRANAEEFWGTAEAHAGQLTVVRGGRSHYLTDADVRRLRTGLGIPLFFAGASLGIAGLGFLYHLQRFFRLNANGAPESLFLNLAGWMISISSLMTVGLLTAILAGLVWFVLSRLVSRCEAREIESLLRSAA